MSPMKKGQIPSTLNHLKKMYLVVDLKTKSELCHGYASEVGEVLGTRKEAVYQLGKAKIIYKGRYQVIMYDKVNDEDDSNGKGNYDFTDTWRNTAITYKNQYEHLQEKVKELKQENALLKVSNKRLRKRIMQSSKKGDD